ncbi:MAG: GreA/GreB family elongation factor [Verrucomicrobia bacterium]|nr:GreA/GreB family elongation factor [Verrucomicrobiota bacterium]MBI3870966.1 GreA/GreB family elongation factor [Verrucomicrobiota bacterium]
MSKAFTRESDDAPESPEWTRQPSPLPPGVKNYITEGGLRRLRAELQKLVDAPPKAATRPAPSLDPQVTALSEILRTVVLVAPPPPPWDQVKFGAKVRVRGPGGEVREYWIVGVDETDIDRGWVSWLSPIAKALLNARIGQRVRFRFPSGEESLEILEIAYPSNPGTGS